VAKRCEMGPRLLLITNRKSHIAYDTKITDLGLLESQYALKWLNGTSYQ